MPETNNLQTLKVKWKVELFLFTAVMERKDWAAFSRLYTSNTRKLNTHDRNITEEYKQTPVLWKWFQFRNLYYFQILQLVIVCKGILRHQYCTATNTYIIKLITFCISQENWHFKHRRELDIILSAFRMYRVMENEAKLWCFVLN